MSNGRRLGCIVAAIAGVVIAVGVGGGTVAYVWLVNREAGPTAYAPAFRPKLAFGDGWILVEQQGFPETSQPFVLRSVHAPELERGVWEWSHQGQGLGSWTRDGRTAAGELISRANVTTAFVFDRDRGYLFEIDGAQSYSSHLGEGGELLVRRGGELSLYRVASGAAPAWSAPLPAGAYIAFYAVTPTHVVAFNDGVGMHVYSRANGGAPVVVEGIQALVGIDRGREEAIALRDGRIEVLALADGANRATIALADAPITDSGDVPCLLGTFGTARVFLYATALDTSHSGTDNYEVLAERMVAAVDEAGNVTWRTSIGAWNVQCTRAFTNMLPIERDLGTKTLLDGTRQTRGGQRENFLAALTSAGTLEWRAESPGEQLWLDGAWISFTRDGALYVGRFGDATLERAIRFPSYGQVGGTIEDEIWISISSVDESARFGPDLTPGPLGSTEALAEVRRLLGLPSP